MNFKFIFSGLIVVFLTTATVVFAEQLPIRKYTIADGLARDYVLRIRQGSHGYLWFCTAEGLSRFDGYEFRNYTTDDGLPDRRVNDFLETSKGVYWIATNRGLVRFNPSGFSAIKNKNSSNDNQSSDDANSSKSREPMFTVYKVSDIISTDYVTYLFEDHNGTVWLGTGAGLFRIDPNDTQNLLKFVEIGRTTSNINSNAPVPITAINEDSNGSLWLATSVGLFRKLADDRVEKFTADNGLPNSDVLSLTRDLNGEIWAGTIKGLCRLINKTEVNGDITAETFDGEKDSASATQINSLIFDKENHLWLGTSGGIIVREGENASFRNLSDANNLMQTNALMQDKDGNVWIGTTHGAYKIARRGFVTYKTPEGLTNPHAASIFENETGEIFAFSSSGTNNDDFLYRFDGDRFTNVVLNRQNNLSRGNWGVNYNAFQDRFGEWWFPTKNGVYRFPKIDNTDELKKAIPLRIFTSRDELGSDDIFHLYEDRNGDVWIGTHGNQPWFARWERATDRVFPVTVEEEYKDFGGPTAFGEDAAGNLWIGFYNGSAARYRDGKFTRFTSTDGLPVGQIRAFYTDKKNRLWIGTGENGVVRVDDSSVERPKFNVISTLDGLASNSISSITEDKFGRLYLAGARGLDSFDPETGRIRHYTTADGLAGNNITTAFTDSRNRLWFAAEEGISRLEPEQDSVSEAKSPPIFISKLQIGDNLYPISELGETELENLELSPEQNRLQVDFVSISYAPGELLKYQYRLIGASDEWSVPAIKRSLSFANLAPGNYRFEVTAINSEGGISSQPALISFKVLPPIWRRWWFITLAVLLAASAIFALDRFRVKKTRQVEDALGESLRAEQAMRESEERFRTLTETASDAIITINRASKIVYVNEAVEKVFGYKPVELIGADLIVLMPRAFQNLHHKGLARYIETGEKHISWSAIELPGQHKDGHEIPLELSFGEFTNQGERYFTGIARDVTERKKSQEALQRAREERLRELEKVRKRIATDLHDDIGSSLTQISLLSEVVRQRVGTEIASEKPISQPLSMIANASRELVDSMSDIVWAINPLKDHLADLTQRMRRFAADVFTTRNIKFDWHAAEIIGDIPLGANVRREIFLIFKESVNNIVKHADCTRVEVFLNLTEHGLELSLHDDGKGFNTELESEGHGLMSMRDRVKGLGGTLEIVSEIGKGTATNLKIPFERAEQNLVEKA